MLPKANHRQMIQFVQDEFVDVQSQYEDLLYDYTILKEKVEDKEGQLVLCASLEREFLKPYIDLFKEMGISISSIDILTNFVIKLTESIDKLKNQSYILTAINGQDVNHYLSMDNMKLPTEHVFSLIEEQLLLLQNYPILLLNYYNLLKGLIKTNNYLKSILLD